MKREALYHADTNELEELPQMEKPRKKDYTGHLKNDYRDAAKRYTDHLYSLRKIPCDPSCNGLWEDRQVLEEGKEYEVRPVAYIDGNLDRSKRWTDTAFPVVPVKSEDLWHDALTDISSDFLKNDYSGGFIQFEEALAYLKSKYIITKR